MIRITGGLYKGHKIKVHKQKNIRPTSEKVRKALFDICGDVTAKTFLDLFAGSGAVGIEALSRGCVFATFVEKDRKTIQLIYENLKQLDLIPKAKVLGLDALKALDNLIKSETQFDIAFVDAPYTLYTPKYVSLLLEALPQVLHPLGLLFIEDRGEIDYNEIKVPQLTLGNSRNYGDTFIHKFSRL